MSSNKTTKQNENYFEFRWGIIAAYVPFAINKVDIDNSQEILNIMAFCSLTHPTKKDYEMQKERHLLDFKELPLWLQSYDQFKNEIKNSKSKAKSFLRELETLANQQELK